MVAMIILHEANGVVAVAKPAGLATQAAVGIPSVEAWARRALAEKPPLAYLGVPHRLDRAVSGVLLLAVTPRAARQPSRQFERREVQKTYLAVVTPPPDVEQFSAGSAEWRDYVAKIPDEPRGRILATGKGGQEAVTQVRVVHRGDGAGWWLLELQPLTGRMHQLRLQSSARGMPVVGDLLYGGPPLPDGLGGSGDVKSAPILLHAWKIAYRDPETGETVEITAPLPTDWPAGASP